MVFDIRCVRFAIPGMGACGSPDRRDGGTRGEAKVRHASYMIGLRQWGENYGVQASDMG